jgi:alpha-L-fucosidase
MSLSRDQEPESAELKPFPGKNVPKKPGAAAGLTRPRQSTRHPVLGGAALWAALLFLWTGIPGLLAGEAIRAFCVDFNWGPGGPNGFAPPGLWADSDPEEHLAWYAGLGANVIQTFALSCNGYTWYQGGKVPPQPGLRHDFTTRLVKLGHARGMKVMGYFCVAANTRWGKEHPDLSYGTPATFHLPLTDAYLDYLAEAITEALRKTKMDGFMVDWLWNPSDEARQQANQGQWLKAEQELYAQLTGKPFPSSGKPALEDRLLYEQKATERCWRRIHDTAKRVKPNCIIWLSCHDVRSPHFLNTSVFKETDWLMDESGTPDAMRAVAPRLGQRTQPMLCLVGWGDRHDARKILSDSANRVYGIYGFSKPGTNSLPLPIADYLGKPMDSFSGNDRNIAALARWFNDKPFDYVGPAVPVTQANAKGIDASLGPRPYPERLRWWAEGRFGLFIHWGPVSLKETEISWSRANSNPKCPNKGEIPVEVYDNLYREFNPTNFSGAEWARLAKTSGVKYMVLTAKHCDGFLLWHSQASDYNIAHTPFRRDICAELAAAARRKGLRIGWYFSPMDWRDPDFRTEHNALFVTRMQSEVRELLTQCGRIDLMWFDWDGHEPLYDQARTYQMVKELQPRIIIDNRLDLGPGNSDRQILSTNADYYTPEQSVGAYDDQRPWESCMTISRSGQWAWGGHKDGVKPFSACLEMLIRCAGGDGNLLLNVGPMPNGQIAPEQADRLKELGAWLAKYGQSIYGTRGGPFKPGSYGASTRNGKTIFLHLWRWSRGPLKLPPIQAKVAHSRVLTGGTAEMRQTEAGLEVSLSASDRQPLDTVIALDLDRSALGLAALDVPAEPSLTTHVKATASNVFGNQPEYGPDKAVDGRDDTRWATDASTTTAWLEVDFGRPTRFSSATIIQAFPELKRIRKFAIEYCRDGQWETCYRGSDPGEKLSAEFQPVTAQRVRLNLLDANGGPTIWEFQLFR